MASPITARAFSRAELLSMAEAKENGKNLVYDRAGRLIDKRTGKQMWGHARRPKKEPLATYRARMKRIGIHV
ncbi:unnamed protein product [marine sediment metagenome]|uniref:Uncharacterized protein n=1 Tax=marine sediment metagenome TaxID=412755 RepID=X0URD5_9ZZZZ